MAWSVIFHEEFDTEFLALEKPPQDELLAYANLLQSYGPDLGRPTLDRLMGSKHANMKELRFAWQRRPWRMAFAFDPRRRAILLVGGNRGGRSEAFLQAPDRDRGRRFDEHIASLKPLPKKR